MKKTLIVLAFFCAALSLAGAKEKKLKNKAKQNVQNVIEKVSDFVEEVEDIEDIDIESMDAEIVSRDQIETMFSLADQLNIDLKAALENKEASMAEEFDYLIAEEKEQLDILIEKVKKSSVWTAADEAKLKKSRAEFKKLSRKYKPAK